MRPRLSRPRLPRGFGRRKGKFLLPQLRRAWAQLQRRAPAQLGLLTRWGLGLVLGGTTALLIGIGLSWFEFSMLGVACLALVAVAVPFLFGRMDVDVKLSAEPQRVTAGGSVVGQVQLSAPSNRSARRMSVDVPVGSGTIRFETPPLGADSSFEDVFVVPTSRRCVIPVGPATTRRGDPLGIWSRNREWTSVTEIFVRPKLVSLDSLGAGILRDLEGVSSHELSPSDLAFHALREYEPGDDLRHIHWRSTAKTGKYMVRQFLDTRRAHLALVVDSNRGSYLDDEEFELAMSVAGSLAVRSLADDYQVSMVVGSHVVAGDTVGRVLDTCCRAEIDATDLVSNTLTASRQLSDCSLVFALSGPGGSFPAIQRAMTAFSPEVRKFILRVDPSKRTSVESAGLHTILNLSKLGDLPMLLQWSVQ